MKSPAYQGYQPLNLKTKARVVWWKSVVVTDGSLNYDHVVKFFAPVTCENIQLQPPQLLLLLISLPNAQLSKMRLILLLSVVFSVAECRTCNCAQHSSHVSNGTDESVEWFNDFLVNLYEINSDSIWQMLVDTVDTKVTLLFLNLSGIKSKCKAFERK